MKRIAVISLLAATALLGSCRFVTIKDSESSSSKGVSASETTRKADEEKIVNRYDVGEFDSVVCSGAFDINYNSGSCNSNSSCSTSNKYTTFTNSMSMRCSSTCTISTLRRSFTSFFKLFS